jgi:mannitol-1-phosphate 5-dehydrogenase
MMHTVNKLRVDSHKIVIFGAGKIGRSFIGQLFGCNGYKIVFVDVDAEVVRLLNERGSYRVVIKGNNEEELLVPNVSAISATDRQEVINAIASAGIASVSVGKFALERVIPVIAEGLELRHKLNPYIPLDIILAENMRGAAEFTKQKLKMKLPATFPVNSMVGLIETSIGKMVPVIPASELVKDPLVVFAEPYNNLILDGKGFKSAIPEINGLAPKNNIKAWVDRKAFIHNLGHATAAYYGHHLHPEMKYMFELLEDTKVLKFTRAVMIQSAEVLNRIYCKDLPFKELEDHADDLLSRFRNRALQDTVFRVGQDLTRKLSSDDRFMGAIKLARDVKMPHDLIIEAMSFGFIFKASDENGNMFPPDITLLELMSKDIENAFINVLHYDPVSDKTIIGKLKKRYKLLCPESSIN